MEILLSKLCQLFILSMHLSTCTLKQATILLCSASSLVNCLRAFRKLGKTNVAPTEISSSLIKNPLSAMISSPGCKTCRKPLFTTISLSDVLSGYNSHAIAVAPLGVILIKGLHCCSGFILSNMQTDYQVMKASPFQTLCNL